VPSPGRYPLVVDPIIGNVRLSKVLMDGGSNLNIIYTETLELLGVDRSEVRASAAPFHGIAPGKRILPLRRIDLPICFGTPSNFWKETLTFEVVGFRGTYHAVLGRPCYAKFMAVPYYTYLKLKMSGPNGIITVRSTYHHAYECDVECVEYAEALAESEALIADLERLSKEAPDAKRHACRCFGSDRTPRATPQGAFRSRMVLSTVAQWFVPVARETIDNGLQVRAALKCVTPYVLARVLYVVGYKVVLWCEERRVLGWMVE
jgi:hypothetical protein